MMTYAAFKLAKQRGLIHMGIDYTDAVDCLPLITNGKTGVYAFPQIGAFLSIPAFVAIGFYVSWILAAVLLIILTPILFKMANQVVMNAVLKRAEEDEDFFNFVVSKDLVGFGATGQPARRRTIADVRASSDEQMRQSVEAGNLGGLIGRFSDQGVELTLARFNEETHVRTQTALRFVTRAIPEKEAAIIGKRVLSEIREAYPHEAAPRQ